MGEMRHRLENGSDGVRLVLEGEIDMRVAPQLRKILHDILREAPGEVVVDMKGVPFIDSSGVATLVEALRIQMNGQRALRIENPNESVYYTFKITQLTKIFGMANGGEE